jgi:uncharacterized protein (UPF0264 family)
MAKFLASVTSTDEARIAVACGADIIDAKEPRHGALGAVALDTLREIVDAVARQVPVSATLGDLPMQPDIIEEAARRTAAAGVDYVKFGIFEDGDAVVCAKSARDAIHRGTPCMLIAVAFADLPGSRTILTQSGLDQLRRAGIHGIMLDTARKGCGNLWSCVDTNELQVFIAAARSAGLMCGLAGSLRAHDIDRLLPLGADILGFRGALCAGGERVAGISADAAGRIRSMIPRAGSADSETA